MSTRFDREELKILTEIGYSAAARGMGDRARPIFEALAICMPDNAAAAIGYALLAIVQGDFNQAITVLERDGIGKRENADGAKSILLMALKLAGRELDAARLSRELSAAPGAVRSFAAALR